jgi:hypothetical protein
LQEVLVRLFEPSDDLLRAVARSPTRAKRSAEVIRQSSSTVSAETGRGSEPRLAIIE